MNSIATASVVMLFASWTSNVLAEENQSAGSSGRIQFSGEIVESPCTPEFKKQKLQISCSRNGATSATRQRLNTPDSQPLPYNLGSSQFRWVDVKQKLGILTVEYL